MANYIFPPLWSQYSADFFTVWPEKGERAAGYPLRGRTNHSRMRDFLNGLGMTDRFDPQQIQDTNLSTPDWKRIDDLLSGKIDTSKSFLSHNTNS